MTPLSWKTEKRKIKDLVPADYNPRQMTEAQAKQLRKSIEKFNLVEIPAIDQDNTILAGHQRMSMLLTLGRGEEEIDVRVPNRKLTQEEAMEYNLRSNKNTGEWDMDKLFAMPDGLLEEVGFDKKEIQKLIDGHTEVTEDDYDVDKGLQTPVRVELGEVWQLGEHRLMCGDPTAIGDVEKLMDGKKADMVFTDPPYGVDYEGINNDSRDGLTTLLTGAFTEMRAVVKPGGACYFFHSDRCADIAQQVFRSFCHFSSMIIWKKSSLVLSQTDYQSIHEPCMYGWFLDGTHEWFGDRRQTSVWEIQVEKVSGHTTPKPLALVQRALLNSSLLNGSVLDLFGGSGSTLMACEQTNRKCYMMELDPKYCTVILDRWEKLTGKKANKLS